MGQQRLLICGLIRTVSAADAVLANNEDRAGCRLHNFMFIVCDERIKHDQYRFCFLCFDFTFLPDKKVYRSCFFTILY